MVGSQAGQRTDHVDHPEHVVGNTLCRVLPAQHQVEHITGIVAAALDDVQGVGADRIGRQVQPHLLLQRGYRAGAGDPGAAKGVVVAAEQGRREAQAEAVGEILGPHRAVAVATGRVGIDRHRRAAQGHGGLGATGCQVVVAAIGQAVAEDDQVAVGQGQCAGRPEEQGSQAPFQCCGHDYFLLGVISPVPPARSTGMTTGRPDYPRKMPLAFRPQERAPWPRPSACANLRFSQATRTGDKHP